MMRAILILVLLSWSSHSAAFDWPRNFTGWWLTPDQQGQRAMNRGDYQEAANLFADPMRRGLAWYRAAEFEQAAAAFGQVSGPDGQFNRGNALLMQGLYEQAISAYQQALQLRHGWPEAQTNLEIARMRQQRLATPDDDHGGTGGKLGADKIVFDLEPGKGSSVQEPDGGEGRALSEAELRAQWLRRVDKRPAEFLQARFSYQLADPSLATTGEQPEEGADDG